jgi:gamma-glutamylaminecyclotransferase
MECFVFVYGTLKQEEANAHVMSNTETGQSHFLGKARLMEKFPLIIGTRFNVPFLLDNPGIGQVSSV